MAALAKTTTDHEEIRRWAESRGGRPSCVRGTGGGGDVGMLRLDFPGYEGEESLEEISWDDWFDKFDERGLALIYQERTAGGAESRFNKLVSRETAEEKRPAARKSSAAKKPAAKKPAARARASATHKKAAPAAKKRSSAAPAKKTASKSRAKSSR
jgi:hypothetical protein